MEFKGTKGKWVNKDIRITSYNEEKKVTEQVGQSFIMTFKHDLRGRRIEDIEGKANALLMSCAPEMLEMLKRSIEEITHLKHEYRDTGHCGKYLHECTELINKATNF